jgi:transcriptional antiterminator NusG
MSGSKKWYVLRVISGKEKKTKDLIESEVSKYGLSGYVGEILVPTEKVIRIQNGKKVTKEKTLFPGYIYIEADLAGEVPHVIRHIPGVLGFLSGVKGGDPEPITQAEVNRLLGKMDEMAMQEGHLMNPFKVGDAVKITNGPFKDFEGIIEEVSEDNKKVKVEVKMFGRKTPVELSYYQVEKI